MKLVKLMVQSLPAALLFATLLALLLFYLNPGTPLRPHSLWRAFRSLAVLHGTAALVVPPLVLLALRFFAEHPPEVGWFRWGLFHRFHLANTAVAAAVWWANYLATPALLAEPAHRMLLAGCGMITLVWVLGGVLSLRRVMSRTPRPRVVQGVLLFVLYAGLVVLRAGGPGGGPGAGSLRPGAARAARHVVVVAIEGLSPDFVLPLAAEGRLPSFAGMIRDGARGRVHSSTPSLPAGAWTTVATGVLPRRHGIVGAVRWSLPPGRVQFDLAPRFVGFPRLADAGLVDRLPVGSADRREPAAWSILDAARLRSGVVGWWATDPPEPVRGAVVPPSELEAGPGDVAAVTERLGRLAEWGTDAEGAALQEVTRRALERDLGAMARARQLLDRDQPAALLVYLPGLEQVQERFLGYAFPPSLRWRPGPPHPIYGQVIARYYRFLDDILGTLGEPRAGDRLVLAVSCSGVRRPPPWRLFLGRVARWGTGLVPPGRPPAGMLLVSGRAAAAGTDAGVVRPVDLLPTILYYLGLPVARDLEGRPRTDLFDEAFTAGHPLTYIPSYRRSLAGR